MKAFLMYRDRDLDLKAPFPAHAPALAQDLDLETLFEAMSLGDEFLSDVARPAYKPHRCRNHSLPAGHSQGLPGNADLIRSMYALAVEALQRERKSLSLT